MWWTGSDGTNNFASLDVRGNYISLINFKSVLGTTFSCSSVILTRRADLGRKMFFRYLLWLAVQLPVLLNGFRCRFRQNIREKMRMIPLFNFLGGSRSWLLSFGVDFNIRENWGVPNNIRIYFCKFNITRIYPMFLSQITCRGTPEGKWKFCTILLLILLLLQNLVKLGKEGRRKLLNERN